MGVQTLAALSKARETEGKELVDKKLKRFEKATYGVRYDEDRMPLTRRNTR